MELFRKIKAFLIMLAITLVVGHSVVLSFPISKYGSSADGNTKVTVPNNNRNSSREDICGNKGRFCEILCKNNPSEGGKMCNCDAYALKSQASNLNCNRYINVDSNSRIIKGYQG